MCTTLMVNDSENLNLYASNADPASFLFKKKKKPPKSPNQQKTTSRSMRVWMLSEARPHDCSPSPSSTPSLGFFRPPYPAASLEQRGQCRATALRSGQDQAGPDGNGFPKGREPPGLAGRGEEPCPSRPLPGPGLGWGGAAAGRGSCGGGGMLSLPGENGG